MSEEVKEVAPIGAQPVAQAAAAVPEVEVSDRAIEEARPVIPVWVRATGSAIEAENKLVGIILAMNRRGELPIPGEPYPDVCADVAKGALRTLYRVAAGIDPDVAYPPWVKDATGKKRRNALYDHYRHLTRRAGSALWSACGEVPRPKVEKVEEPETPIEARRSVEEQAVFTANRLVSLYAGDAAAIAERVLALVEAQLATALKEA